MSDERGESVDGLERFPRERRWLLPALQTLQHAAGYLSTEALARASAHLRVPLSEVYGVATHYPEFRLKPRARHHVRVCTGVSCALRGGRELLDAVMRRHRVEPGRWSPGDEISLETADCFFECGVAPLIEVDGQYRGRVSAADIEELGPWVLDSPSAHPGPGPSGTASPPMSAATPLAGEAAGEPDRAESRAEPTACASEDAGHRPERGDRARSMPGAVRAAPGGLTAESRIVGQPPPAPTSPAEVLAALVARADERCSKRPALQIRVQAGTCGRAVGAGAVLEAMRAAVRERDIAARVIDGACNGMCYAAPVVEIERDGWPRFLVERLEPAQTAGLVECLLGGGDDFPPLGFEGVVWAGESWRGLVPVTRHAFWARQERVLLARCGAIDPDDLDDALRHGAYRALAQALDGPPPAVIESVKAAGLQGRGGAFFPTALKWDACRKAAGEPRYVVMNGEEGEPGIFKDRHLMEGDPHQVLEGVLLAAYAAGATRAVLYVHGEAELSAERLERAVAQAAEAGIVGERVLGGSASCSVELRRGAGGFVLGEETALLESIEGRRAQPRTRPPFPVESGLWGKPTVINNVETLAAIPAIVARGGRWFAALGTAKAPGTKVFGLSGPLRRPGVVEVRNGVTLRTLVEEIGGGALDGAPFQGAVVGGPSGTIVPAGLFDVPMEPREQVSPGTGGIVAVPAGASVVEIVRTLLAFNANESCGKCTPCREGIPRLLALLEELEAATEPDPVVERVRALGTTIQLASLCGLGQAAPLALLRAVETFADALAPARREPRPG